MYLLEIWIEILKEAIYIFSMLRSLDDDPYIKLKSF